MSNLVGKSRLYNIKMSFYVDIQTSFAFTVTDESTTRKIKSVNVFRKKILTEFVTSPSGSSVFNQSREPPLVTVPPKLHDKIKIDSAFIEKISQSLQEFLQINHKSVDPDSVKSPPKDTQRSLTKREIESQQLTALSDEQKRKQLIKFKTQKTQAFINASVNANVSECASYVLSTHLKRDKQHIDFGNASLYIDLLSKYAFNKQWKQISQLLDGMKRAKVQLTPQIFMIVLDCLGRLPESDSNIKSINFYLAAAAKEVRLLN